MSFNWDELKFKLARVIQGGDGDEEWRDDAMGMMGQIPGQINSEEVEEVW